MLSALTIMGALTGLRLSPYSSVNIQTYKRSDCCMRDASEEGIVCFKSAATTVGIFTVSVRQHREKDTHKTGALFYTIKRTSTKLVAIIEHTFALPYLCWYLVYC